MKHQHRRRCPSCGRWRWILKHPGEPLRCTRCRREALGLPEHPRERHRRYLPGDDDTPSFDRAEINRRIEAVRTAKQAAFGCTLSAQTLAVILGDKTMDEDNRKIKVVREPAKAPAREECKDHTSVRRIVCGGGYRVIRKRIGAK